MTYVPPKKAPGSRNIICLWGAYQQYQYTSVLVWLHSDVLKRAWSVDHMNLNEFETFQWRASVLLCGKCHCQTRNCQGSHLLWTPWRFKYLLNRLLLGGLWRYGMKDKMLTPGNMGTLCRTQKVLRNIQSLCSRTPQQNKNGAKIQENCALPKAIYCVFT